MLNINNEIIRASISLGISFSEVSQEKTKLIIGQIINKYCNSKKYKFLWEGFIEKAEINDNDAWRLVKKIVGNEETLMFFNPEDEKSAFIFLNGEDIEAVLSETFGFEFYLTNKAMDYVICFNHHNFLIGCGRAIEWLKKIKDY